MSFVDLLRKPSAWLPVGMSLAALAVVSAAVLLGGARPGDDEGAAAHIFQILIAGQLPVVACFAVRWLRGAPRQAAYVLLLQAGAGLLALAPVYFLGL